MGGPGTDVRKGIGYRYTSQFTQDPIKCVRKTRPVNCPENGG
jgi:hypothetical protein